MLERLRRIVQEVGSATSLDNALNLIVQRVKTALAVDVCSVYLTDQDNPTPTLILKATEGLNWDAVDSISLGFDEGLVGLVAQRAEPVSIQGASTHPRYRYFPDIGEEQYDAFLGVPIIHRRQLLGVLVVQQREWRSFSDDAVAFLFTLAAQLAGVIVHAMVGEDVARSRSRSSTQSRFVDGLPGASGIAMGRALVAYPPAALEGIPDRPAGNIETEIKHFREAIDTVKGDMEDLAENMSTLLPPEERALFEAYAMMLDGDSIRGDTIKRIRDGNWAAGALRETVQEHARVFEEMDDPYLRERASDIRDLGRRIMMRLQQQDETPAAAFPEGAILVGEEITAPQLASIAPGQLAGIVSVHGSTASHVAILARALGVPTVMGAVDLPLSLLNGKELIIDGYRGRVYVDPNPTLLEEFRRLAREEQELAEGLTELQNEPTLTPDGVSMALYANAGLQAEISPALLQVADGIGLYRTEIPFLIRQRFPGEDEQRDIYRVVLKAFAPRPVVVRTLDVGGDKSLPYFPVQEENPFLGWRGIRITLDHPEIFLHQVRAMLKANEGLENLKILLPMISRVSELQEAMVLIQRAHLELLEEGIQVPLPNIGVMVEVPSAVYQIDAIARRVDFISVGTNDLTQYLLAVDRNNERVGKLYDSLHPAVLCAIQQIKEGASRHGKTVTVCGELAGNPLGALLLLGMGVDGLSMSGGSLLRAKWVIRTFSQVHAKELLKRAVAMEDGGDVRAMLTEEMDSAGLGGLLRAGK